MLLDNGLNELARRLHETYGIIIPTQPNEEFISRPDKHLNSQPSPQSLIEIERAISEKLPYAGNLVKIISFYETYDWAYIGRLWPKDIGRKDTAYDERPLMIAYESHLITPDGRRILDYDLPAAEARYPFIKTERDRFRAAFFHELGHGIDFEILFRKYNDIEKYVKQVENGTDSMPDHPIYITFGELTGWKFGKGVVAQRMKEDFGVDIGDRWLNPVIESAPSDSIQYLAEKERTRIQLFTRHPITRSITEIFAEFFEAYLMAPEILTDEERSYFNTMHDGLKSSPEKFMEEVARNPRILLM